MLHTAKMFPEDWHTWLACILTWFAPNRKCLGLSWKEILSIGRSGITETVDGCVARLYAQPLCINVDPYIILYWFSRGQPNRDTSSFINLLISQEWIILSVWNYSNHLHISTSLCSPQHFMHTIQFLLTTCFFFFLRITGYRPISHI